MQPLQRFGALEVKKYNPYNVLGALKLKNATPTAVWGPGPLGGTGGASKPPPFGRKEGGRGLRSPPPLGQGGGVENIVGVAFLVLWGPKAL